MSGGGSSQPSTTTSTQTSEPPAYVRPYLATTADQARRMYEQGPNQYYGGETVTPFSSQTQQALDLTQQRALNGSPVSNAAEGFAQRTLSGAPTSQFGGAQNPWATQANPFGGGSNPYLDNAFNKSADAVQNRLNTGFASSGRNLEAARPLAAQELNDLASNIYGGDYQNERNRQAQFAGQLNSIGAQGYENERSRMAGDISQQRGLQGQLAALSPVLAGQDYADIQALQGVGSQYEDLRSRQNADAISRWDYSQNAPGIALDQYIARLNNQPGGSQSVTTPYFTNQGASILGGASAGYGLGSQFGGNGGIYGTILGGILGGYGR